MPKINKGNSRSIFIFQTQVNSTINFYIRGWVNKSMTFWINQGFSNKKRFISQRSLLKVAYMSSYISPFFWPLIIIKFIKVLKKVVCLSDDCIVGANVLLPNHFFKFGNTKSSLGARSRKYGERESNLKPISLNFAVTSSMCVPLHSTGRKALPSCSKMIVFFFEASLNWSNRLA